jgi:hypothetical protein
MTRGLRPRSHVVVDVNVAFPSCEELTIGFALVAYCEVKFTAWPGDVAS